MFDAKSLFEQIMKGSQPAQQSQGQGGGLGDIGDLLRQFTEGGQQGGQQTQGNQSASDTGGTNALDELMRQFTQGRDTSGSAGNDGAGNGGGALDELMRQFTQERGSSQSDSSGGMRELPTSSEQSGSGQSGGLGDLLGQVFGQDQQGGQSSGNQNAPGQSAPGMRELLEKIGGSGAASGDMVKQLTDFIGNNKLGAGAALGGLGALVFGTQTGRSMAMGAAKIGALAVVGGLAYKAYQNYSQGRPLVSGSVQPEAAPAGTGFEEQEVSNDAAVTYIRGMIAAAAADGRISADEQQQIIGTLSQHGVDSAAEEFLANELNNPASIDELVNGVSNDTESLQLYTAARVAIEPDTQAEGQFLAVLADRLGITPDLRDHVDAAARGMA